jgi:phage antirepressor YoqD-like protein
MSELISFSGEQKITSLSLVEQINIFRTEEGKSELGHNDLLKVIREEFEDEIGLGEISQSSYLNSQNKQQPMFELTTNQAKQVLARESKLVRKKVFEYIARIEKQLINKTPNYEEALSLIGVPNESVAHIAKTYRERDGLKLELKEAQPKLNAFENVIDNANTYTLDSASDILNIGRNTLAKILEVKKWKTVREKNGTSSTRYAEENGYAKTIYEYIKINSKDIKTKRFVLKKKGLDKLINEQTKLS